MLFSASSLCEWTCTLAVGVAKSEVYDSDGSVVVNEQILRFEVSMHDVELMDVLDASDDLLEDGEIFGIPAPDKYLNVDSRLCTFFNHDRYFSTF